MSVETTGVVENYVGDGGVSLFPYPNYLRAPADLVVVVSVADVATTYALNAQPGFTFAGVADGYGAYPTGGNIQFVDENGNPDPPDVNAAIMITRFTPRTNQFSPLDNGPFVAAALAHQIDNLYLIAQEGDQGLSGFLGMLPAPPVAGTEGQWFIVSPAVAGQPWGYVCTVTGNPATWNAISDIGL